MAEFPTPSPEAQKIANGHAFTKHVAEYEEFPEIGNKQHFAVMIDGIIRNPTARKVLSGGRTAYWAEPASIVVITDPGHPDGGTCFRPAGGKAYYERLQ